MLIHMGYQVTLPDHDFILASKYKLIPSGIGDMKLIKSKNLTNDAVTYSGATSIGIRSAKHSAPFAHFQDMMSVRSMPEFAVSFQTDNLQTDISYKLWNKQIQNVAQAFNHHSWKLFLKDFYHQLYQLFTRMTELNQQKMT